MNINILRDGTGIRITNLPKPGFQRITISALERHKDNVTVEADRFIFHTVEGDVVLKIIHEPGRYCLTCQKKLPDHGGNGTMIEAQRAKVCREHVASHGKDAVKREDWPHGYSNRPQTYKCHIEDKR